MKIIRHQISIQRETWGFAVLVSFLCRIPVNKIPHYGIAVISKPMVCNICAFNLWCPVKQNYLQCCDTSSITTVYMRTMQYGHYIYGLCYVFLVQKIVEIMTLIVLQNIILHADVFPFLKKL